MRAEAQPLIDSLGLKEQEGFFSPLPCKYLSPALSKREGEVQCCEPLLGRGWGGVVLNGVSHDRDLIGCEAAAVTTQAAIQKLQPDLVISVGTCGGWQRYGARVGQTYIADGVMFHDRRVPGDNEWDTQGLGNYPVWEGSWRVAEALGLPMGKVTTGSSFDLSPEEETLIDANGGRLKEMEGAAVAFVCSLYKVPVMLVKAVTNLRDVTSPQPPPTPPKGENSLSFFASKANKLERGEVDNQMDDFHENLKRASLSLKETLVKIIEKLS